MAGFSLKLSISREGESVFCDVTIKRPRSPARAASGLLLGARSSSFPTLAALGSFKEAAYP